MANWGAEDWVTFLGAAGLFVGALAAAVAVVIKAMKGQFEEHEARAAGRAKKIMGKVDEDCDEPGN